MHELANLIDKNSQELAELEALDNGKPVTFAGAVDVAGAAGHLRYYAGWPTKIEGETIPVSWPNAFVYTLKEPVGVAAGRGRADSRRRMVSRNRGITTATRSPSRRPRPISTSCKAPM